MKYFGERSLSSIISLILHIIWYVILVGSIIFVVIGIILMFSISFGDSVTSGISKGNFYFFQIDNNSKDWQEFKSWPLAAKIIAIPYYILFVILLLNIIKKTRELFFNFKKDIIFNKKNALIISKISKLNIVFSIITFNFSSLLVSILLFMLCEIFNRGSLLQEEHDFTV